MLVENLGILHLMWLLLTNIVPLKEPLIGDNLFHIDWMFPVPLSLLICPEFVYPNLVSYFINTDCCFYTRERLFGKE